MDLPIGSFVLSGATPYVGKISSPLFRIYMIIDWASDYLCDSGENVDIFSFSNLMVYKCVEICIFLLVVVFLSFVWITLMF